MTTAQIRQLLEELLSQTRRNQELLEQIAHHLGMAEVPNAVRTWSQPAAPVDQFNRDPGITPQVAQLVAQDKLIAAIKSYRQATGAGLAQAKEAVERYRDQRS